MNEALRIGANVATPLGLCGIGIVIAFWVFRLYLRARQKRIDSLPENQRLPVIEEGLKRYGVSAANLTREAKERLLREEMAKPYRITVLGMVLGTLILLAAIFSYVYVQATARQAILPETRNDEGPNLSAKNGGQGPRRNLPEDITEECMRFRSTSDEKWPAKVVGTWGAENDNQRGWMEDAVFEANNSVKTVDQAAKPEVFWFLHGPESGPLNQFTLSVYVGSPGKVACRAWRLYPDPTDSGPYGRKDLKEAKPTGVKEERRFDVASLATGECFLVLVCRSNRHDGMEVALSDIRLRTRPE